MSSTITLEAKLIGRRQPLVAASPVSLPDLHPPTLRSLITQVVLEEVNAFRKRQAERRLTHVLTAAQIDLAAQQGKVSMGQSELQQAVDPQDAVTTAIQAFEDGLYLVFVDGEQPQQLDDLVNIAEDSHVLFVRLVALAGG
jgi:hypothetical protein